MTVSAIGNQADQYLKADFQSPSNTSSGGNQHTRRAERESDRNSGDTYESRFRPSSASDNEGSSSEAGTYQVSQFQFFSASATALHLQPSPMDGATSLHSTSTATAWTGLCGFPEAVPGG